MFWYKHFSYKEVYKLRSNKKSQDCKISHVEEINWQIIINIHTMEIWDKAIIG